MIQIHPDISQPMLLTPLERELMASIEALLTGLTGSNEQQITALHDTVSLLTQRQEALETSYRAFLNCQMAYNSALLGWAETPYSQKKAGTAGTGNQESEKSGATRFVQMIVDNFKRKQQRERRKGKASHVALSRPIQSGEFDLVLDLDSDDLLPDTEAQRDDGPNRAVVDFNQDSVMMEETKRDQAQNSRMLAQAPRSPQTASPAFTSPLPAANSVGRRKVEPETKR